MLGSNTFGLYRQGWSGITIDPVSTNVEFAGKCRPRDTSILAVVRSTNEEKQFWEYETYEFSTTVQDRVNKLGKQGIFPIKTHFLKSKTLSSISVDATPLDPYVLSIDVEGAEIDVLRGNDWTEFTPPIIVVEEHTPPWAKVSEISDFFRFCGYELSDYIGLTSVYIHTDRRFRMQRSNQVIKENSNNLHLD